MAFIFYSINKEYWRIHIIVRIYVLGMLRFPITSYYIYTSYILYVWFLCYLSARNWSDNNHDRHFANHMHILVHLIWPG